VIRGEAIGRLRDSEDCKEANRRAAKFWTESVSSIDTIRQALAAFEAYYQYVEIKDFEQSAKVIVNERCNRWGNESELSSEPICTLGASFIRLGLFHQIIVPTTQALNHINPGYQLSRLYNILGDCYWLAGRINEATQSHQTSGEIAAKCNLKRLELASIFNMALCKEDLWEFQEAIELYRRVLSRAEEIGDGKLQKQALYGLAHIYSYSNGDREKVARLIERVQEESEEVQLGVRSFGYKLYAVGFSFGYIGMIDQAVEMYRRAILYSERSGFVHLKGMSLTGLAVVFRDKKEYEKAFFYHVEAIELLNKIGAINNLAKAYHQMGLTYQEIGEADPSNDNFQEAIRLFTEMKAPKQVERVRRSMNGKT
jgi:tetratricopeptide (TPR) repeat protein